LFSKGFVESRNSAQALVMKGVVYVNDRKVDKAGSFINLDSRLEVRDKTPSYVSRGGVKLEHALKTFDIDVRGKVALDVGASTGGFTDCLLQHGAEKVFAIDVGYGQLHWKLRNDPRVVNIERLNARYLKLENLGENVDIVTIDVSFISLVKIIPSIMNVLKSNGTLVCLVKPQFEVGKGEVGKGGIVRDETKHKEVIRKISTFLEESGFSIIGIEDSPILGAEGNKEFLSGSFL